MISWHVQLLTSLSKGVFPFLALFAVLLCSLKHACFLRWVYGKDIPEGGGIKEVQCLLYASEVVCRSWRHPLLSAMELLIEEMSFCYWLKWFMEKCVFRSLNKWGCVLELLEVEGRATLLGACGGSKAEEIWRLALGNRKRQWTWLSLLSGTVKRSKLWQTLEYGCRHSVFVECLIWRN